MSRRQTTGTRLDADTAFVGIVDFGLFAEKVPPCFTSEGLAAEVPPALAEIAREADLAKLGKLIAKESRGFMRYQTLRDINIARHLGVPHPQSHVAQCLAIKRCWEQIKKHCAKPAYPSSRIFVRDTGTERVFVMSYKGQERKNGVSHQLLTGLAAIHTEVGFRREF